MTPKELRNLRRSLEGMRRGTPTRRDVVWLAEQLGRELFTGRGKEPTYISKVFPTLPPLSIPKHGNSLKRPTAMSVLRTLETYDLAAHERRFASEATVEDDDEDR